MSFSASSVLSRAALCLAASVALYGASCSSGEPAASTSGGAGTGGSGGASGSGAGGAGGTAGATGTGGSGGDPCATALFCDDFEKYTTAQTPGAPWSRQTSAGSTAVIDTAQFHSGTKSVKFVAAAGTGSKTAYLRLMSTSVLPVMPNMFYGRMMFRLEAAPTGDVHWTFLEGSGLIAGQNYHALYRYGGQHPVMNGSTFVGSQMMANYETPDSYGGTGPSSDCWKHSNKVVVPVGKWSCAEWQFDGATNTMRFWLDGAAVDTLTVTGTGEGCVNQPNNYVWTAPTFDRMDLGWESYQQDDARTIWIDDVVLSKTKVGCPQ
jgi:polysaccharide lyase-like protein